MPVLTANTGFGALSQVDGLLAGPLLLLAVLLEARVVPIACVAAIDDGLGLLQSLGRTALDACAETGVVVLVAPAGALEQLLTCQAALGIAPPGVRYALLCRDAAALVEAALVLAASIGALEDRSQELDRRLRPRRG